MFCRGRSLAPRLRLSESMMGHAPLEGARPAYITAAYITARNVRHGSLADIGEQIRHVRLPPKADVFSIGINVG
jgi:hypothetical protein